MQREIIFRGQRIDNGEWVYGYVIHSENDGSWAITNEHEYLQDVDGNTVCQFTGMKDRNGKRIFEFDIVCSKIKYGESYGVVVFRNGRFSVDWRIRSKWTGNGISCRTYDLSPADEVVGTIFDNPEIFEVKTDGMKGE